MKINFLTIHYNTPNLLNHLIMSISKFVPDYHIYVFDNSDRFPFKKNSDKITVFDNTKGQYINFDKWLQGYPNRHKSLGKRSNWGSAKHCKSVDICMDLIDDNFILCDTDILLKKDVSDIYDDSNIYVGEIENWGWGPNYEHNNRVLPFLSFINNKKCHELGIRYFNDRYMDGLYNPDFHADSFDTGCYFYMVADKYNNKKISLDNYIVHYKGGSYAKLSRNEHITEGEWLNKYKYLWRGKAKKVVYTCITGGYDSLIEPRYVNEDFDYVCYTDDMSITSDVWEIRALPECTEGLTLPRKNRMIKILAHKFFSEYDLSVYVDSNVEIKGDINKLINEKCKEGSMFFCKHPARNCLYDEMDAVIKIKKDTEEHIKPQRTKYKSEGFPKGYGLTQNNIIIRRHNNPDCIRVMEDWWKEVSTFSHRDQLSLYYVLWKDKITIKLLDKKLCNSEYFAWNGRHTKGKKNDNKLNTIKANTSKNIENLKKPIARKKRLNKMVVYRLR